MIYKHNDLKLYKIGLGCGGMRAGQNKAENIATIHRALDNGINMLNTADFYGTGESETIIGEALKGRRREANEVHQITFVEAEYSLFNREIEQDILKTARELGIGVVTFGSLAHGLLSGAWSKEKSHMYNSMIPLFFKENIDKNLELVENLKRIALKKQISLPQLALSWLLSKGDDIITLVGASKQSTLLDSLKAKDIVLNKEDIKRIENAIPKNEILGESFPKISFKNGSIVR